MTQRIPENFSAAEWNSSPSWATRCRRETPTMTMTMMMTRTKATTPNRTTSASRRSSENPTKTNRREGSCNSSPAGATR